MKKFFLDLLNSSTDTSSKRFISITSLFMFFVLILYSVYRTTTIDPNIIYALVSLILGSSVMTLVQRNRNASNISNRNINENITENTNNGVIN